MMTCSDKLERRAMDETIVRTPSILAMPVDLVKNDPNVFNGFRNFTFMDDLGKSAREKLCVWAIMIIIEVCCWEMLGRRIFVAT